MIVDIRELSTADEANATCFIRSEKDLRCVVTSKRQPINRLQRTLTSRAAEAWRYLRILIVIITGKLDEQKKGIFSLG